MGGLILSDINLTLKVKEEKVAKIVGMVNQVSYKRGYDYYAFKRKICPRLLWCSNVIKIDQT